MWYSGGRVKPPKRVLDMFCGAGGAAMGLHRAWPEAEIVGVDIEDQPRYPFRLVKMDWRDFMALYAETFDWFWASPVCKRYTQMLNHGLTLRTNHPDQIPSVQAVFRSLGKPYVIENVAGAPLRDAVMLCGTMFGLKTLRHRFFECSFNLRTPDHPKHNGKGIRNQRDGGTYYRCYGHETGKREWGRAMGIDWMKTPELAQAVPPAYSEYIAKQYLLQDMAGGLPQPQFPCGALPTIS